MKGSCSCNLDFAVHTFVGTMEDTHSNSDVTAKNSPRNTLDHQGKIDEELPHEKEVNEPNQIPETSDLESPTAENSAGSALDHHSKTEEELPLEDKGDEPNQVLETGDLESPTAKNSPGSVLDHQRKSEEELSSEMESLNLADERPNLHHEKEGNEPHNQILETGDLVTESLKEREMTANEILGEKKDAEPVFDGTEDHGAEETKIPSSHSLDIGSEVQGSAQPEKASLLKNFVRVKDAVSVSNVIRRLSGKRDEDEQVPPGKVASDCSAGVAKEGEEDSGVGSKPPNDVNQTVGERSVWNPLNFIRRTALNVDTQNKAEQGNNVSVDGSTPETTMKGRIILYTRLGCKDCKEVRLFLHYKALRFIEINIDIYPSRKSELEKNTGSSAVPKVFFNDLIVGGLSELKEMAESGKLDEKINDLINEEPSPSAPLPPLSGEDDVSGTGAIDELAITVRKMRESIVVKDRFSKMRRFTNCFVGSEAVDFLSEDQYLEREEAVELARKLASKHFFHHVLDENIFEDGNQLYRFLDHDPIISSQCYNIPKGIIDVKPKHIVEIASRLRFLSFAIFEAYVSEDGRHVDYRSIHSSEEFARYLRTIEELQRVDLQDLSREEKIAFFINLYNMMAIHGILTWGYPVGALERRKLFGDFKYVVGGGTYSLSMIQNGILRGNQRPPYNLMKPFGLKDIRFKVALPYPEPLTHFALVCGTRSGPALRCYSPGNIDKELVEAAENFLRNGGIAFDAATKVASVSKILSWYSVDFGKNEMEVIKHAANYLEPAKSEELLELLANSQLKVTYQPYDWALNC